MSIDLNPKLRIKAAGILPNSLLMLILDIAVSSSVKWGSFFLFIVIGKSVEILADAFESRLLEWMQLASNK
jgi:hypothetical protein